MYDNQTFVMNKHYQISIMFALFCLLVIGRGDIFATDNKASDAAIELRTRLVTKLDSLDIEKQILKRNGQSFDEIEQQQTKYFDSLNALRKLIQDGLQTPDKVKPSLLPFNLDSILHLNLATIIHPVTVLDWTILITSTIAILSFLFFILALLKTTKKAVRTEKRSLQSKNVSVKKQTGPLLPLPETPHPVVPAQQALDSLNKIKQNIQNASEYYEKTDTRPSTQRMMAVQSQLPEETSGDLEQQVLEAYKNGADIHEISRKLQISTDHVSLLLKIKGIAQKKPDSSK